jgi:hypothetical protein
VEILVLDYQPTPEPKSKGPRNVAILTSIVVALTMILFRTTLASNISINTSGTVEFGQGVAIAAACSGSTNLTILPSETFTNGSGTVGNFYFNGYTVSNIPASCSGSDFIISAYDSVTASPLPLYNTSTSSTTIWDNSGTYTFPTSQTGASITTNSTSSFTVTFSTPVTLASSISKFTLDNHNHVVVLTCAQGGACNLGDTGPGGGLIFYTNSAGFNCGPSFTSTGSPTGGLCHNLEVAPSTWAGAIDPGLTWSTSANATATVTGLSIDSTVNLTLAAVGLGYLNSVQIVNQPNDLTTAAGKARAYHGNSLSDWYLPDSSELSLLCQWDMGEQPTPGNACTYTSTNSSSYGAQNAGFLSSRYWSSSQGSSSSAWTQQFAFTQTSTYAKTGYSLYVRPIRAF